jgi:hypothetical protein
LGKIKMMALPIDVSIALVEIEKLAQQAREGTITMPVAVNLIRLNLAVVERRAVK